MVEECCQPVRGICQSMCPVNEAHLRKSNRLVHCLEMVPNEQRNLRTSNQRTCLIKEFQRPAAGKIALNPEDLRPAKVLMKTVKYLFFSILPCSDIPWCRVYDFIFDRLRAVRQDMVIQRINDSTAVRILEMNIRFLIYARYRLCRESMDNFDPEINRCHTMECLKRLLVLYSKNETCSCNLGEFLAFYMLYNLGSDDVLLLALELKQRAISCPIFKVSFSLTLAFHCGNFLRVFKLMSKLPVLHLCALNQHLNSVRSDTLRILSAGAGSRSQMIPLTDIAKWLACDADFVVNVCTSCGLVPEEKFVAMARTKFQEPSSLLQMRSEDVDTQLESNCIPDLLFRKDCELHCRVDAS